MGPRARMEVVMKKYIVLCRESKAGLPSRRLIKTLNELYRF